MLRRRLDYFQPIYSKKMLLATTIRTCPPVMCSKIENKRVKPVRDRDFLHTHSHTTTGRSMFNLTSHVMYNKLNYTSQLPDFSRPINGDLYNSLVMRFFWFSYIYYTKIYELFQRASFFLSNPN